MLSIVIQKAPGVTEEFIWHTGEPLVFEFLLSRPVVSVIADGDELELIKRHPTNLPMHDGLVVMWTGDLARFVLHVAITIALKQRLHKWD